MNVKMILKEKGNAVETIDGESKLIEASRRLTSKKIGALVVVTAQGSIAGVLSERDIVSSVAAEGPKALEKKIHTVMTSDVATCGPCDTIEMLMALMTDRRIRHLPVLEDGRLAGIVSIGDVVKARIADAEAEASALKAYITAG